MELPSFAALAADLLQSADAPARSAALCLLARAQAAGDGVGLVVGALLCCVATLLPAPDATRRETASCCPRLLAESSLSPAARRMVCDLLQHAQLSGAPLPPLLSFASSLTFAFFSLRQKTRSGRPSPPPLWR